MAGYRRPGASFYQCLQYTLVAHNEVGNFWTHFIPFIGWLVWLFYLAMSWEDFFQPYNYPLICFWIGACSYALFSSIAHLFSCKSLTVLTISFMLDYLGIAMYGLGANIAALFYFSPINSPIFSHTWIILFIDVCMLVSGTALSSLSRFFWEDHKFKFAIRLCAFVPGYLFSILPYLHRLFICWVYTADCFPETASWHPLSIFSTAMAAFFYCSKVPERFFPGKFDIIFQSHQIFHVCTVCTTSIQMYLIPMEIVLRKDQLLEIEGARPSLNTTLLPFVIGSLLGLLVVSVVGNLTIRTNKRE